jgi:2-polyprenyl-3-methyl-5-hydroxy-6-metoxy-1,4-benzoquinol methylase
MPVLPALDRRERFDELMDDPALDPAEHRLALAGLARVNRLSRSADVLWPPVARLVRRTSDRPVRILDVATGSGDVALSLVRKAARAGVRVEVAGCDVSPTAVRTATEAAGGTASFFVHDVIRDPLPTGFDVVTCSLFLHHLSEPDAVTVLRRMKDAAARLVLVNDLERCRLGYLAAWVGTRLLSRSRVVRYDGPVSVRQAFTPHEAVELARAAGLTGAAVGRRFPFRFLLRWRRKVEIRSTKFE